MKSSHRNARLSIDLRQRMRNITRVRYGYRRIHVLFNGKAGKWGGVRPIGYMLRNILSYVTKMPNRRKMLVSREARVKPTGASEAGSMNFVEDRLYDGTKFRALTIVDLFSHEALAIDVGQQLLGEHAISTLNRLVAKRQVPKYLFVDKGSEFSG
jgi:putative transposase